MSLATTSQSPQNLETTEQNLETDTAPLSNSSDNSENSHCTPRLPLEIKLFDTSGEKFNTISTAQHEQYQVSQEDTSVNIAVIAFNNRESTRSSAMRYLKQCREHNIPAILYHIDSNVKRTHNKSQDLRLELLHGWRHCKHQVKSFINSIATKCTKEQAKELYLSCNDNISYDEKKYSIVSYENDSSRLPESLYQMYQAKIISDYVQEQIVAVTPIPLYYSKEYEAACKKLAQCEQIMSTYKKPYWRSDRESKKNNTTLHGVIHYYDHHKERTTPVLIYTYSRFLEEMSSHSSHSSDDHSNEIRKQLQGEVEALLQVIQSQSD